MCLNTPGALSAGTSKIAKLLFMTELMRCGSAAVVRECGITNTMDLSSAVSLRKILQRPGT